MKAYEGLKIDCHVARVREARGPQICEPLALARDCADLAGLAQEAFVVVTVNTKNRKIARHLITLGVVDASLVHPREVFRAAIADGATAIILAHNHPSGDPAPSSEDLRITRQLVDAGKILDVRVLDHVIIGREIEGRPGFLSLRESGLVAFG